MLKRLVLIGLLTLAIILGYSFSKKQPVKVDLPVVATSTSLVDQATTTEDVPFEPTCPPYEELVSNAPEPIPCFLIIKEGEPPVQFDLATDKTEDPTYAKMKSITVIQKRGDQILVVPQEVEPPMSLNDTEYLQNPDFNFDGYNDLKLLSFWGATGNMGYQVWLYQPRTRTFVESKELSEIINVTTNPETKEVLGHYNGGGGYWEDDIYEWHSGKLVLTRFTYQDYNTQSEEVSCVDGVLKERKMVTTTQMGPCAR